MNTHEIAQWLISYANANVDYEEDVIYKSANMLRQQADRIAELEKQIVMIEKNTDYWADKKIEHKLTGELYEFQSHKAVAIKKQSEPVAWVYPEFWKHLDDVGVASVYRTQGDRTQPLYTTPHHASDVKQTKPLSDEEICELWKQSQEDSVGMSLGYTTQEHYFARLIEAKVRGES